MGSGFSEADADEKAKALALAKESDVIVAVVGGSSSRFGGAVFDANGAASKGTGSRSMDCGEGMDTAKGHIPAAQGLPEEHTVSRRLKMLPTPFYMHSIRDRWAVRQLLSFSMEAAIRPVVFRFPCHATWDRFRYATITGLPLSRRTVI